MEPDLAAVFDCLRSNRLALVSAHRGQIEPRAAENVIGSFERTRAEGPILIELDVRRSSDGGLLLLHDPTLERTTTGKGRVEMLALAQLIRFAVRDGTGRATTDPVPTFDAALAWARAADALVQVDVKRGVPFSQIIAAVRAAGAARRVIIITYTLEEALEVARLAPEMMISASIPDEAARAGLLRAGAQPDRLLNFLGTEMPAPEMLQAWNEVGIETIVGTLGAVGRRLDDRFMADGDGSEYAALAAAGVALIASDRPRDAWAALKHAGRSGERCLGERR